MATKQCDVLVIGGGHAGAEAAWAAAHLGARTILATHRRDAIARMSCNPAIGGIGKGQIVREIDALGGLMGLVADEAGIQFRLLNRRKGPAVRAPRAQADSDHYPAVLRRYLEGCPNLTLIEAGAVELHAEPLHNGQTRWRIIGATLSDGTRIDAGAVVVAAGTFMRGLMHTGADQTPGGRVGEAAAQRLSAALRGLGLRLERLKTGTPPRVARATVDFDQLRAQDGDADPQPFSFMTERITQPQVCCWLSETNAAIHELIRTNMDRAPLFSGQIQSTGPRYCPSIETKVDRFPDKASHQVFLEPEGRDSERIYVNGISTSLPRDVQAQLVALLPGLERARIVQWGYAIEYDYAPPTQIDATLMTKSVGGLFLAGQVNGTSGYEEAAGQGLLAGVNAARRVAGQSAVTLGRDEAYIGVMIDDLVTRGVVEPYRMFTSRAEHRMHLRCDNADTRLTPLGREIGLAKDDRWAHYRERSEKLAALLQVLRQVSWEGRTLEQWLKRPDEDGERFRREVPALASLADGDTWDRARVLVKYDGYIARERRSIERFRSLESRTIPPALDYGAVPHLRHEARERLSAIRPRNLGQASRISGVQPTDVTMLMVYLGAGAAGNPDER